jgi:hypothetical protein
VVQISEFHFFKYIFNILLCVDFKSVLDALQSRIYKVRRELISEIKFPHCVIYWNEITDKLAKDGPL